MNLKKYSFLVVGFFMAAALAAYAEDDLGYPYSPKKTQYKCGEQQKDFKAASLPEVVRRSIRFDLCLDSQFDSNLQSTLRSAFRLWVERMVDRSLYECVEPHLPRKFSYDEFVRYFVVRPLEGLVLDELRVDQSSVRVVEAAKVYISQVERSTPSPFVFAYTNYLKLEASGARRREGMPSINLGISSALLKSSHFNLKDKPDFWAAILSPGILRNLGYAALESSFVDSIAECVYRARNSKEEFK